MIVPGTYMVLRPTVRMDVDQTPLPVYVERWASPRQTRVVVRIQAEDGTLGREIVVHAYRLREREAEGTDMMGDLLAQEI